MIKSSKYINIELTSNTMKDCLESSDLSNDLAEKLKEKNALLIPEIGIGPAEDKIYYPSNTSEFYYYIKKNKSENLQIDLCIDESDYQELAQHDDTMSLPLIIMTSLVAPIVVSLISEYLRTPVPAGIRLPTITFSFKPRRSSRFPLTAASVSTRVVSWKAAAEIKLSVLIAALVMPKRSGLKTAGFPPSCITLLFSSLTRHFSTISPSMKLVLPGLSTSTF